MQYKFFALISRMRYIARWGLMRNTFQENFQGLLLLAVPMCRQNG